MPRTTALKFARLTPRQLTTNTSTHIAHRTQTLLSKPTPINLSAITSPASIRFSTRPFTTSPYICKGISPTHEEPNPAPAEPQAATTVPANISQETYEQLADAEMDNIVAKLEEMQETKEEVDVEYSAGVLTLNMPKIGTYVINKQPPNKQIWLSSPISGPKRYDFVVESEGQNSKEGTGEGDWVYLRDGSSLGDLLLKEVGIDIKAIV